MGLQVSIIIRIETYQAEGQNETHCFSVLHNKCSGSGSLYRVSFKLLFEVSIPSSLQDLQFEYCISCFCIIGGTRLKGTSVILFQL